MLGLFGGDRPPILPVTELCQSSGRGAALQAVSSAGFYQCPSAAIRGSRSSATPLAPASPLRYTPAPYRASGPVGHARPRTLADPPGHARGPRRAPSEQETQMPKMKTKSSVKKRFKITATGKVKAGPGEKRHMLGS